MGTSIESSEIMTEEDRPMARIVATLKWAAVICVVAGMASGCSQQRTVTTQQFGDAVRDVMNSQIHDYEAAIHPEPNAVEGSDSARLNTVVETYREDIGSLEDVQQPIMINVGGNR